MTGRRQWQAGGWVVGMALVMAAPALGDEGPAETPRLLVLAESQVRSESESDRAKREPRAASAPSERAPARMPVFVPRTSRGAPASRIGGASRSGGSGLVLRALVPELDEAAVTISEMPSLAWHLSAPTEHAVNFTLVDPDAVEPVLDLALPGPFEAGVHRIDLAAHGAKLALGKSYLWFVAVVRDPSRRSADVVARGAVQRVAQAAPLAAQIAGAAPDERAAVLAGAGLWYDALDTIQRRLPEELAREQQKALLAQVGIELE